MEQREHPKCDKCGGYDFEVMYEEVDVLASEYFAKLASQRTASTDWEPRRETVKCKACGAEYSY